MSRQLETKEKERMWYEPFKNWRMEKGLEIAERRRTSATFECCRRPAKSSFLRREPFYLAVGGVGTKLRISLRNNSYFSKFSDYFLILKKGEDYVPIWLIYLVLGIK